MLAHQGRDYTQRHIKLRMTAGKRNCPPYNTTVQGAHSVRAECKHTSDAKYRIGIGIFEKEYIHIYSP